jgi:putative endonuclease
MGGTTNMEKQFYVYIMTNIRNTVLYTGITNNLRRRVQEHRHGTGRKHFTSRYNVRKLVYYEIWPKAWRAIRREKQIKAGPRRKKIALIESMNPGWEDLTPNLTQPPREHAARATRAG